MSIEIIREPTEAEVQDFQSLRGKRGHVERDIFIAENPKVLQTILESRYEVQAAYMTAEYFERFRLLLDGRPERVRVMLAHKDAMERVVGYALHQGAMLSVRIPKSRSISEAAKTWTDSELVVALDGIADAENMGAIVRNCAAFGVRTVLVDPTSCSPYLRRAVRVSMGAIVNIEIITVADLATALLSVKAGGKLEVIGASLAEGSIELAQCGRKSAAVIVLGSEGWGLSKPVASACDKLVRIPMAEGVDSLNVAIASGIFLYALQQPLGAPLNSQI